MEKGKRWKVEAASLLVLALLLAQPAGAVSYPVTIAFGRSWPISIVVDSTRGVAYVDATSGDYPPTGYTFGIINSTSHGVSRVLPLNEIPGPMALDQSSGDVYVAGNESIEVFDWGSQSFVGQIGVGRPILSIAYDGSVSQNIFFTSGDGVFSLDPRTGTIVQSVIVQNGPNGMALDPANGRLYVSEYLSSEVAVFQASNLANVTIIKLPTCCASQLGLDSKTQKLYASTGTNFVDVINAGTDTFERSVQVAPSVHNSTNAIAVDNGTGRVYVATSPGGSILELDGAAGAVVGDLKAQSQVAGLALDSKTQELYATNYHQITVFDASRGGALLFSFAVVGALVVVALATVYLVLRRRNEWEKRRMRSGLQQGGATAPRGGS